MTDYSYRLVPWTLACLIAAILPHFLRMPLHISLLIALTLLWRVYLHRNFKRLPKAWITATLGLGFFIIVIATFKSINGVLAGGTLLIGMVAIKTLELNTLRDHIVLVLASFFIIVAFVLDDTSIWSAIYLIAATFCSLFTLLKVSAPELSFSELLPMAKKTLLYAIPLTLLLFILFPRIPGPLWGLPKSSQATTGLSDSMSPGSITDLIRSDELAFRARFIDREPERKDLYWRGPVLNDFDGRKWENNTPTIFNSVKLNTNSENLIIYEVIQEPTNKKWLYVLDYARNLPNNAFLLFDYQVKKENPIVQLTRFTASAQIGASNLLDDKEHNLVLKGNLRLPDNIAPQTKALVTEWKNQYQRDVDIVNKAFEHFNKDLFSYTLSPKALNMSDPVDDFLFRTKEGFCEHYASAFVVMMRHAGIPARVVTGYLGGEKNFFDGYYRITQADAHAWTEVYLVDRGWTRVDPTAAIAPERIEQRLEDILPNENLGGLFGDVPFFLRMENAWFALNTAWYNLVLDFDSDKQMSLLKKLGFKQPNWQNLVWLLISGIIAGTLLMSLNFWRQSRKSLSDPLHELYLKLKQRLYKKGLTEIKGEGPSALKDRASLQFSEKKELINQFITLYIESRYFQTEIDTNQKVKLQNILKLI